MDNLTNTGNSPPPAPPLPPSKPEEKPSISLKLRAAPPDWALEGHAKSTALDHITPPAGPYFFYGTLQDPGILSEVLRLDDKPALKPARVVGYAVKLWGQYPALVDGSPEEMVEGAVFEVANEAAAARLAQYETKAYRARPCLIRVWSRDEGEKLIEGFAFLYDGRSKDLSDGEFDLKIWLRRMGRT
ncbi:unnamed protein product [Zymoseptoria tritici ST99CH_3D1]|nr:unnamed protein product [Zymoseptoria tritici ST99CH_3D1]